MSRSVLLFLRSIFLVAAGMIVFMALASAVDMWRAQWPLPTLATFDVNSARHLNNLFHRNLNQLVAIAFTTVAIAVPLTANMYSLKFLELFVKDPVNGAVLTFVIFTDLNNTWWGYSIREHFIPYFQIDLTLVLVILCFSLSFPYLYYIFRFLHPNTLLERLETEIQNDLRAVIRQPRRAPALRQSIADNIEHIANISIRSVDRGDRNTAIESAQSLERVLNFYWERKPHLPAEWFEVENNLFLGFSSKAVGELAESRSWLEMKLFSQLRQVMNAGLTRMHDLVSTVSKSTRRTGLEPMAQDDPALRTMVVDYFNTFIRMAITRKDPRSVFILFDQYRLFAEVVNAESPEAGEEIAYYFDYYGQAARDAQLPFVVEAIAHDLGTLVQHAWSTQAANGQSLLNRFLEYDRLAKTPLLGVKKAHALLGSYFLLTHQPEPAEQIRRSFHTLEPLFLRRLTEELMLIKREKYWEVNERRMNMDYVPDDQREKLREFLEGVTTPVA